VSSVWVTLPQRLHRTKQRCVPRKSEGSSSAWGVLLSSVSSLSVSTCQNSCTSSCREAQPPTSALVSARVRVSVPTAADAEERDEKRDESAPPTAPAAAGVERSALRPRRSSGVM